MESVTEKSETVERDPIFGLEENGSLLYRTGGVLNEVIRERAHQIEKWNQNGPRRLPGAVWHLILSEEVGEVAEALLQDRVADARAELIQVAAVAVATIQAIDDGRLR